MQGTQERPSKMKVWLGWLFTAIPVLLLTFSAVMKFVQPAGTAEGFAHLGWPLTQAVALGVLELSCTILYLIPRTSVLGAILVAAYLGGATATHVRIGDPFFAQPLLGMMAWGGLYLRDSRIARLIPFRSEPATDSIERTRAAGA